MCQTYQLACFPLDRKCYAFQTDPGTTSTRINMNQYIILSQVRDVLNYYQPKLLQIIIN